MDANKFKERMKKQANREKNIIPQVEAENEKAKKNFRPVFITCHEYGVCCLQQ